MSGVNENDFANVMLDISQRANATNIKLSNEDDINAHHLGILIARINTSIINLDTKTMKMLDKSPLTKYCAEKA